MGIGATGWRILAQVRSWFRAATGRGRLESDMESELAHHLECVKADLVRSGMSPCEAARRAHAALGSPVAQKEEIARNQVVTLGIFCPMLPSFLTRLVQPFDIRMNEAYSRMSLQHVNFLFKILR